MQFIFALITVAILLFGFVVLFGAPYLPTLKKQTDIALDLLDLKPGQTILELGCGDGRVLKAAAQKGLHGVGYELNPILVIIAKLNTWKYRDRVHVYWGDYWQKQWPKTDAIFVFLLDKYMKKLDTKIAQDCDKPLKLVSFAFEIKDKKPTKVRGGLFLYTYR